MQQQRERVVRTVPLYEYNVCTNKGINGRPASNFFNSVFFARVRATW